MTFTQTCTFAHERCVYKKSEQVQLNIMDKLEELFLKAESDFQIIL